MKYLTLILLLLNPMISFSQDEKREIVNEKKPIEKSDADWILSQNGLWSNYEQATITLTKDGPGTKGFGLRIAYLDKGRIVRVVDIIRYEDYEPWENFPWFVVTKTPQDSAPGPPNIMADTLKKRLPSLAEGMYGKYFPTYRFK